MSLPASSSAILPEYLPQTFVLGFHSPEADDRLPVVPFSIPDHERVLNLLFAIATSGTIRLGDGESIEIEGRFSPKRVLVRGRVKNERVLRSLADFAMIGSEDLRNVRMWVDGYPYARIATEYANELRLRNRHPVTLPELTVDDAPFFPVTYPGAEPMRVAILSKRRIRIRLRGIPIGFPFARAANGEIRRRAIEAIAKATGINPPDPSHDG